MRISILGAGAIGCYLATRLSESGAQVQVIARGETLAAIRENGVRVEGHVAAHARPTTAAIDEAMTADVVITCLKAYAIAAVAPHMSRLVAPGGLWVCAVNGIPWWYGDSPLDTLDAGGSIRASFPIVRTAGCIAYLRSEVLRPGVVAYTGGKGLILGMPDGSSLPLLETCSQTLTAAGVATSLTSDIRSAVWNKLFGNVSLNPLTALTGCPANRLLEDPQLEQMLVEVIDETMRLARAEGCQTDGDASQRVRVMSALGDFRTSMLQDGRRRPADRTRRNPGRRDRDRGPAEHSCARQPTALCTGEGVRRQQRVDAAPRLEVSSLDASAVPSPRSAFACGERVRVRGGRVFRRRHGSRQRRMH